MEPGQLIADRFEILRLAATGGMGAVYQARDRSTGGLVALKVVLAGKGSESFDRFEREARVLADLSHPAIVGHVADGSLDDGSLFLAMEWLEGEDLASRLGRVGLLPREAIGIAVRVAEAIGAAHARGVVHRDIKPSNVFLVDRDPTKVKVLDFGIATLTRVDRALTRTGTTIGTPGYIAPEQARGGKLDGKVDLFSLGCVLFECLTGAPPFIGDHPVAVLAKVLLEDPPRVRDLVPGLPQVLDDFVAELLEKDPARRPRDAALVATALTEMLPLLAELSPGPTSARRPTLTKSEHRLVSVILATRALPGSSSGRDEPMANAETLPVSSVGTTPIDRITRAILPFGGRVEVLADGSLVVSLVARGAVTDQAARAARAALVLRELLPDAPLALATGRGVLEGRAPSGEAIDRATFLVGLGPSRNVRIDEVTARLVERHFEVLEGPSGIELCAERPMEDRGSLTAVTPCVGRDRELTSLEALFDECVDEPAARAVLIIAPAGVGKSRLRREIVQRLARKHEDVAVWTARGDPMSAGAPLGLVSQLVLEACGAPADADPEARRRALVAHLERIAPGSDGLRVATFLGELVDAPFSDEGNLELAAARSDPMLMSDQTRRAFEDLLEAETRTRPLLLALDDLHWGDQASVKYVDHVLRQLHDRPLLVLSAGRPEVEAEFPSLFSERDLEVVRLGELPKRAAESLVRAMLGAAARDDAVARIVERAAGNALYLEELVRAHIEGKGDDLPETVLAMVEARLASLEGDARLVLRAASIFGRVFWRSGVESLLDGFDAGPWLELLSQREIVLKRRTSRFADEEELSFRHALFREAAYAMLTPKDRLAGHRLAGEWLEAHGEREPVLLAEHFALGGAFDKSAIWYERGASQALARNDLSGAITLGTKALEGATGDVRVAALTTLADANLWRAEYASALARANEALRLSRPGSELWYAALAALAVTASRAGDVECSDEAKRLLLEHPAPTRTAFRLTAVAASACFTHLLRQQKRADAEALLASLSASAEGVGRDEPLAALHLVTMRSWIAMFEGHPERCLELDSEICRRFEEMGDVRHAAREKLSVGYDYLVLGMYENAERALREGAEFAKKHGLPTIYVGCKHNLALTLKHLGRLEEAERLGREAIAETPAESMAIHIGNSYIYLGLILRARGKHAEARGAFEWANSHFADEPALRAWALAEIAACSFDEGAVDRALEEAVEAKSLLDRGQAEEGAARIRLVHAQILHAVGRHDEARAAILEAQRPLLETAASIQSPEIRRAYTERVDENARILALAKAWSGGG